GGLVAALAEGASAAVPPALSALTLRAAVSGAAVSAQAGALAKGALQTMTTTGLKHGIVLLLAVGVDLSGAVLGAGVGREALLGARAQATDEEKQADREGRPPSEGAPTKVKDSEQAMSDAIRVADVDFQVVCDAKCQIPPSEKKQFVDLGLRLTN